MRVTRLSLTDFRNYRGAELSLAPGLTVIVGGNGEGKTSLLEAIAYVATLGSFRDVPSEALVRDSCQRAVVRAEVERSDRSLLLEAELSVNGRDRVLVNRQPLRRARDLLGSLQVTVFSPDDLRLVKSGPTERRRFLDDVLVALHPRYATMRSDLERVLRQRNALLRQVGPRLSPDEATTLDVWDARLVQVGEALASARAELCDRLEPLASKAYDQVAHVVAGVALAYEAPWRHEGLGAALAAARSEELRRGVSLVGPQRDDVALAIGGRPARTHASQGEQRSLALALRLASHAVVSDAIGSPPVLLLDDVFSELDPGRAEALLAHLPVAQTLLTTVASVPPSVRAEATVRVSGGALS